MPADQLKKRKVVFIDIAAPLPPKVKQFSINNDFLKIETQLKFDNFKKEYNPKEDPAKFASKKTGRGPLGPNWQKTEKQIMCVYKLVCCHAKFFGVQRKLEKLAQEVI